MTDLIIRPWIKQDAQALAAIANNRNIWNQVRDALPSPYTVMDALQWIAHTAQEKPTLNFAVVADGQVVGSIGCKTRDDIYRKTIEIGYFIGEPFWNRGYAREAVRKILQYISLELDIIRVEAFTFDDNEASIQVLKSCGFQQESVRRKAVIKNGLLRDEYVWVWFTETP